MRPTQQLSSVIRNRNRARLAGLLLLGLALLSTAAQAAAPTVDDRAGLFSGGAVKHADLILQRIYENTTPHKQVFVETMSSLPAGKQADALAAERFRQHNTDGLLILMVKDPHKLAITVGRSTEERFRDAAAVRSAMLERFRRDDYDSGLLAGLQVVESDLTRAFGAGTHSALPARLWNSDAQPERASSNAWLWLLLLGGGGLLAVVWLWRRVGRRTGSGSSYSPPYGERGPGQGVAASGPGQAAPGGGGWVQSAFGGVAGALAGNWLYDRFFHGDHTAHAAAAEPSHDSDLAAQDHGEVGSTVGGDDAGDDWGSSGGDTDLGSESADW